MGVLTFCGSEVNVKFDVNGISGKECFMKFENGYYKNKPIVTRHPNLVRSVIIGKKSWGLWVGQWSDGISDLLFSKKEIVEEFTNRRIEIPENLMKEFDNMIVKKFSYKYKNNKIIGLK